jgi:predicted permease
MSFDIGSALRQLRRSPGLAAVVILTFALGIGANTAIFSAVRAVLLAPLPFAQPRQLVAIGPATYSYPDYLSLRRRAKTLTGIAAYVGDDIALTGRGQPREVNDMITAGGIFHVLGVRPALGRGFRRGDDQPGAAGGANAAILSHRLWVQNLGGDPTALGRRIVLNGQNYAVVGVMPAGFHFPLGQRQDVWTTVAPLQVGKTPPTQQRSLRLFHLIGRRRAGVALPRVQAELAGIAGQLARQYPGADARLAIRVQAEQRAVAGPARRTLWLLFAAVGLVLLIACANVSNLLLARGAGRRQELAVRAALGAGQGQLAGQLLAESAVLGVLGGVAGLALAWLAMPALLRLAPHGVPRLAQAGLSWPVLLFALGVGLGAGLLFGWLPAAGLARPDLRLVLEAGGRGSSHGRSQRRWRGVLVAAEFALTLALLIPAGLLIRSLANLRAVNPGFQPRHLLTAAISLPTTRYSPPQMNRFYNRLAAGLEAQPGILAAGSGHSAPFTGNPPYAVTINWPLHPQPAAQRPDVPFNVVTQDYFHSRGPRLLLGEQSGREKAAKFRGAARPRQTKRRGPQRRAGGAGADWGPRPSRRASGTPRQRRGWGPRQAMPWARRCCGAAVSKLRTTPNRRRSSWSTAPSRGATCPAKTRSAGVWTSALARGNSKPGSWAKSATSAAVPSAVLSRR